MMRRRSAQDSRVLRLRLHLRPRRVLRPRSGRVLSAVLKRRRECSACSANRRAGKPVEAFDAEQLKQMLWSGQPDDAHRYLERFLPVSGADWSELCTELFIHVGVFKTLAKVVAGGAEGDRIASLNKHWLESPRSNGLDKIIAVMHGDRTRGSMLWQRIKPEGVDRIMDLVARCPELQSEVRVQLPRKRPMLWGAGPNRLPECPRCFRRTPNRVPADLLVRSFLHKRLLSIQGKKHSARSRNSSSQSATPYMKALQIAPQPAVLEGVSHTPAVHHLIPSPSKNSGICPSATNAALSGEHGASSTVLEKQGISSLDMI